MDKFSPEFSAYWQSEAPPAAGHENPETSAKQTSQELALEELAERVNAARSIV